MPIIAFGYEMVIGRIYPNRNISDHNGDWHRVSIQILRQATREEFLSQPDLPQGYEHCTSEIFFYEVSID